MVSFQWSKSRLAFLRDVQFNNHDATSLLLSQAHCLHCSNLGAGSNPSSTPMVDSISQGEPHHIPRNGPNPWIHSMI